ARLAGLIVANRAQAEDRLHEARARVEVVEGADEGSRDAGERAGLEAERGEVLRDVRLIGGARNVRKQPRARLRPQAFGLALTLARQERRQVVLDCELYGLLKAERRRPLRRARRAGPLRSAG